MKGSGSIVRQAVVLGLAVLAFGVSFGLLAVASGLTPAMACAMSLLVFAGASQFAAVGVIAAGGSPLAAVASGLLLNLRFVALGLALAPRLEGDLPRRLLASQVLVDESAAFALAQPDARRSTRAFWVSSAALFVFWNGGTALGALAGRALGDPRTLGLDAAFPAGILALLVPLLRTGPQRRAAAAGALIAVLLTPLAPPGMPIVAAVAGVLAGTAGRRAAAADGGLPPTGGDRVAAGRRA